MENFNKLINKIAAIAKQDHINFHEATYDMLQAYRSTPHPATKSTPYELLMNRQVRTKIDHSPTETSPKDDTVRRIDQQYKEQAKRNHDKRHRSKEYKLKTGDAVIVKPRKEEEWGDTIRTIRIRDNKSQRNDGYSEKNEGWKNEMQRYITIQTAKNG